jgi:hypothetical protein
VIIQVCVGIRFSCMCQAGMAVEGALAVGHGRNMVGVGLMPT